MPKEIYTPAPEFFTVKGTINPEYKGKDKVPTLGTVCDKLCNLDIYIEDLPDNMFWWTHGRIFEAGRRENISYPMRSTPGNKIRTGLAILAGFAAAEHFHNINPSVVRTQNLNGD